MSQRTASLAVVAALAAVSCSHGPLQTGDTDFVPGGGGQDASPTSVTVPPLNGVWSGAVSASAPGFAWGPQDTLTLAFNADGSLESIKFGSNFPPPHVFGTATDTYPLQGMRDVPLTPGSGYSVSVTVQIADFARDHFHLRYHIVGIGGTPATDYVEDVSGQLQGMSLAVTYTATGTLLAAPIGAKASGQLHAA
jgi:hypothetical protein